ncbi:hypothetical protein N0V83_001469 [Neocucurbitaria cava]|uniref:Uncharacterized protein n=1 Tax=Neocucurbitaria cava TaxID=798079 RepID=A0A9W8YIF2_9PLEO|nr:hypothetical protein N0V83_001469 [Neocucurbitaria cava]
MLLLVARQWQVLRGAPAVPSALCRSQRLSRPAFAATTRSYAQHSKPDEKKPWQPVPLNGAIIIPTSIPNTQPADLIHFIKPIVRERITKETFCVLFVTPAFAPWLLKDEIFLQQALARAYGELWKDSTNENPIDVHIQALCAVVDKLPAGRRFKSRATVEDEIMCRTKLPPVAEAGFEGIAYVTLPDTASVSSSGTAPSDNGAVDFIVNEGTTNDSVSNDTLRLPLANTVFQTGTRTTMMLSSWKPHHTTGRLELISKMNISHHGIRITGRDRSVDRIMSSLSIPLVPLTVPRRVEGCMGNIIRRVVGAEGKSVTASSELEEIVPQFFKSRGEPAQTTTAWALVIPRSLTDTTNSRTMRLLAKLLKKSEKGQNKRDELWGRLWRSEPPLWNNLASKAVAEGARLHRVLSGGGGWGKKAGLLSLDPVPASDAADQSSVDGFPGMLGDPEDFASTLTPVVHDGDLIQFFISPKPRIDAAGKEVNSQEKLSVLSKDNTWWGWELGTIPSTLDSMPGGSWQHTASPSEWVSVFRNSFGALAEGGLMLTRRLPGKKGDPSPAIGITMVDVPCSRFWAVELAEKVGSVEDVGEPKNVE